MKIMRKISFTKTIFLATSIILLLSFNNLAYCTTQPNQPTPLDKKEDEQHYAPNEIIVKFKTEAAALTSKYKVKNITPLFKNFKADKERIEKLKARDSLRTKTGLKSLKFTEKEEHLLKRLKRAPKDAKIPDLSGICKITLEEGTSVEETIKEYQKDPNVEYAQPNYIYKIYATPLPNEKYIPNDYYVRDDANPGFWREDSFGQSYPDLWGLQRIQLIEAHNLFDTNKNGIFDTDEKKPGQDVIVAAIDTGVDYNHEDIAQNIWSNSDEIPNNGVDDDENGYIDDVRGYDVVDNDNDPIDTNGHGTHVAGTISAVCNNSAGIVGVSPFSQIMPVNIFSSFNATTSEVTVEAILYAANNGADVLSNSWGPRIGYQFYSDPAIENIIDYAYSQGCVIVFAAGNDNIEVFFSPQNHANVILVGATDYLDKKAPFSNWGDLIDIAAPGVDILSLIPLSFRRIPPYALLAGTSMACPHVSGLAALVLSRHPEFSNEDVRQAIRISADDIESPGPDIYSGQGRINAYKALQVNLVCQAHIRDVTVTGTYDSTVKFYGTASGRNFQSYKLEIINIDTDEVISGKEYYSRIEDGLLGEIVIHNMRDGYYIARVTVKNREGLLFSGRKGFLFDRLIVTSPSRSPTAVFSGNTVEVTGRADLNYTIKWREYHSQVLSSVGVTMGGGDGILGSIDTNTFTGLLGTSFFVIVVEDEIGNREEIVISVDLDRVEGWPIARTGEIVTSPAIADIDGDGEKEIVAVYLSEGRVYAWNMDGSSVPGWEAIYISQIETGFMTPYPSPVVADLDPDCPGLETIIGSWNIYAFHGDGTSVTGWPHGLSKCYGIAVADMDGDSDNGLEVIATWLHGGIRAWHGNGEEVNGWPPSWPVVIGDDAGNPVVADLDGNPNNGLEVVVASSMSDEIYAIHSDGTFVSGWPKKENVVLGGSLAPGTTPALADIDPAYPGLEVVMASFYWEYSKIFVWHSDGTDAPGWPKTLPEVPFDPSPTIGDLDGDGDLEILLATNLWTRTNSLPRVYAWHHDGREVNGWPQVPFMDTPTSELIYYEFTSNPILVDLDGVIDNGLEVVVGANSADVTRAENGELYAWYANGNMFPNFPKLTGSEISGSPVVADIDGNGTAEIAVNCLDGKVYLWSLPYWTISELFWPMYRHDSGRTGCQSNYSRVGTIRGRVYDISNNAGLSGVTVTLKPHTYEYGGHDYVTTTDIDGNYEISNINKYVWTDGGAIFWLSYRVFVSLTGYEDYQSDEMTFSFVNSLLERDVGLIPVDSTPPVTPIVTDQGQTTTAKTRLTGSVSSSDPESGITEYQYKITQDSISGPLIKDWTSTGTRTFIDARNLSLLDTKTYYFSVKAKNGVGLWSNIGYSDGIQCLYPPTITSISPTLGIPGALITINGNYFRLRSTLSK
ncbi:MAG: S8 family serine peptidase, partial [Candidatus Omnitrophica bacterium]|nr:S8 family serine peptidase [Candidatus Omnitrophota bacterium]